MIKNSVLTLAAFIHFDRILYDIKKRNNFATILSLHRISDEDDFFWPPIKIKTFKKLLEYCSQNYSITGLSDLSSQDKSKPKLVLSFDDGYSDFIENALPELARFGVPSNHNVVINCVEENATIWTQEMNMIFSYLKENCFCGTLMMDNKRVSFDGPRTKWQRLHQVVYQELLKNTQEERTLTINEWKKVVSITSTVRMMNWDQIKKCQKNGVEIGSHTVTHQTLSALNDMNALNHELSFSKKRIEEKLQVSCKTLALPNGQYNEAVINVSREIGYERVLLVGDLCYKPLVNGDSSFLLIPRINMVEESEPQIKLRIEGFHQLVKHGRI